MSGGLRLLSLVAFYLFLVTMDKFPSHITYHSRSRSWLCTGSWIRCHTGNDLPVVMLHRCKTSTRAKLKITEIVIHTSRWEENILQTNFADNKNIMLTIQNIDKWEEKKIQCLTTSRLKNTMVYFDLSCSVGGGPDSRRGRSRVHGGGNTGQRLFTLEAEGEEVGQN